MMLYGRDYDDGELLEQEARDYADQHVHDAGAVCAALGVGYSVQDIWDELLTHSYDPHTVGWNALRIQYLKLHGGN